ncbi:TRAP transporter substrate-binding protein [Bacillus sp. X1(2014)]|uniref:TRAP transporter substrate-binding protein n=1 Tax=Bacillus sp. X1(2014) TaxID=1565991 RepID=UPI0011A42AC7|nr:TRAP transporter substrate-binding protein [Bacillus sp. X1(2014)]
MGLNLKKGLLGVLMSGLLLSGCSSQSAEPSSAGSGGKKQETMNIRIAYNLQKEHSVGVFFETLAKEIEKNTENTSIKIKAQTFSDGQLYNDTQMGDAISQGGVEIGGMNAGLVATSSAPLLASFDLPFLFDSWEAEAAAIDGEYGNLISKDFENLNIKLIGWAKYGTGDLYGSKPINVPSDLKKLKFRSVGQAITEWLEDMGAAPVTMSSQEVFQAMERGMIDGYATGASSVIDRSFYEVTKYGTDMNTIQTTFPAGANLKWWKGLPDDVKEAILKAGKTATDVSREKAKADDQKYKDKMQELGVRLHKPNAEEFKLWKESTKDLYKDFLKTSDKAQPLMDAVQKANEENPAK